MAAGTRNGCDVNSPLPGQQVHTQSIPPDAPVCRACEKFIKRNTGRENVVPRWIPKDMRPKTLRYCMVEGCGEMSHTILVVRC